MPTHSDISGGFPGLSSGTLGPGYHSRYLSGWCDKCGRKRGTDGRCANCDAWWTNPLIQTGGPVVLLGTLLLLISLPLLQHRDYTPTYVLSQKGTSAPVLSPAARPSAPVLRGPAAYATAAPVGVQSAAIMPHGPAITLPPPPPNPDALRWAEFQQLRVASDNAAAALRADDAARAAFRPQGAALATGYRVSYERSAKPIRLMSPVAAGSL